MSRRFDFCCFHGGEEVVTVSTSRVKGRNTDCKTSSIHDSCQMGLYHALGSSAIRVKPWACYVQVVRNIMLLLTLHQQQFLLTEYIKWSEAKTQPQQNSLERRCGVVICEVVSAITSERCRNFDWLSKCMGSALLHGEAGTIGLSSRSA